MDAKGYKSHQMGDAAEMLVAANLTLHGIPSFTVPRYSPGYDVVAQLPDKPLQKISVKCRGKSAISVASEEFDWIAIVLIKEGPCPRPYEFFIIPKDIAKREANPSQKITVNSVRTIFANFQDNFGLER